MADKNQIKVRVLSDISVNDVHLPSGRVATLDEGTAKSLSDQGIIDDNPSAVKYALSVNSLVIDPFAAAAE